MYARVCCPVVAMLLKYSGICWETAQAIWSLLPALHNKNRHTSTPVMDDTETGTGEDVGGGGSMRDHKLGRFNENLKLSTNGHRVCPGETEDVALKCSLNSFFAKTGSALIVNNHLDGKIRVKSVFFYVHVSTAAVSSPNGEFGEWNAFPGGQIPTSAQSPDNSGSDLFGAMAPASPAAPAPAAAPASADLFDLMGPTQSLTSSQSLNFSMSSTQTLSTNITPQSMSQVCMEHRRLVYWSLITLVYVPRPWKII